MKRSYFSIMPFIVSFLSAILSPQVIAADDDECANYLCLPAGFGPSECSDPHDAMRDRLKDGKSPLPSFSSCFAGSSDSENVIPITTRYGNATIVEGSYTKNRVCRRQANNEWEPIGCNGRNYWFVEVYDENGTPYPLMSNPGDGRTEGNTRYIRK